jgi:hypothetical protein
MLKFDCLINPVKINTGLSGNMSMLQYRHSGKLKILLGLCSLGVVYILYLLALETELVTW